MDNSIKAIIIGASVVITLVIVSIGFLVLRQGQEAAGGAIDQIGKLNSQMSEADKTMYDGREVSGSEVVNVLSRFKNENIGIIVKTGKNTGGSSYIRSLTVEGDGTGSISAGGNPIANTLDESKSDYVNPNGRFKGKVIRDKNGTIVGIVFEQQT